MPIESPLRVGLFVTCLVDLLRPRIGFAALELLEAAGCRVMVPQAQTCCGQPAWSAGDDAAVRALAQKFLDEFEACDYVVVPSGSCAAMARLRYPALFAGDEALVRRMSALAAKTFELSDFLVHVAGPKNFPDGFCGSVTCHDSCTGLRDLGIKAQPRALLDQLLGVVRKEMPGAEECCGFGGAFSVRFGELSAAIAGRKCESIQAVAVDAVVGGDLGCLLNIEGRLRRMGDERTRVLHIAEALAGATGEGGGDR